MTMLAPRILLAYGALGLPLALLGLPLFVYLPVYYAEDLGLGLAAVGAVLLVARTFDVVSDPLVGVWSDRVVTRFGRRLPWIALGLPLLMCGVVALFRPPAEAGLLHLFSWSIVTYLGWTLVALPYQALGAELSPDYHERSRLTVSREGAAIIGTVLAVGLAGWVQAGGGDAAATLGALAVPLLITLPLAFLWLAWQVREPGAERTVPLSGRAGWRLVRDNHPFRRLLIAWLLNGMANALPATLVLMYIARVLDLSGYTGLFLGAYFLSGVLTLPLWLAASRRFGKHRVWAASMLWAALVFAFVPLLGTHDLVPFLVVCVLTGASLGVDNALPAAMQADVIDADRAAGGGERAGLYFGLWGMTTKAALALAVGIAFPLLDGLGALLAVPDAQVLTWLYAGLPVVFKLAVVPLVWNFPIDAAAQAALRARLDLNPSRR